MFYNIYSYLSRNHTMPKPMTFLLLKINAHTVKPALNQLQTILYFTIWKELVILWKVCTLQKLKSCIYSEVRKIHFSHRYFLFVTFDVVKVMVKERWERKILWREKSIFLWEFCLHYLQSLCEHRECTSDGILWFGEEVEVLNSYGTQGEILFCILFFVLMQTSKMFLRVTTIHLRFIWLLAIVENNCPNGNSEFKLFESMKIGLSSFSNKDKHVLIENFK